MIKQICQNCEIEFESRYYHKYCSHKCHSQTNIGKSWGKHSETSKQKIGNSRKGKYTGSNSSSWKPKVEFICVYCDRIFNVIPSRADTAKPRKEGKSPMQLDKK